MAGSSSGGLYKISDRDNSLKRFAPDEAAPFNLPSRSVWKIEEADNGQVLLATSSGVFAFDSSEPAISPFGDVSQLKSVDVFDIAVAPEQSVWLSLWEGGVTQLSADGDLLGSWTREDGLQRNSSVAIRSTADNQIFVLNASGLFRFNKGLDLFEEANPQANEQQCKEVDHINTGGAGRLWAICDHKTLWRWHDDQWQHIAVNIEGWLDNVFAVHPSQPQRCESNNVCLYVLAERHLIALNASGEEQWHHALLPLVEDTPITQAVVIEDELIMAATDGIYRQSLLEEYSPTSASFPLVNGIRLFNKPFQYDAPGVSEQGTTNIGNGLFHGHLHLEYEQDLITFEFAQPGYHAKPIEGFRYRLVPFDRDWNLSAEDDKKASYTRLPPGRYEFKVQVISDAMQPAATF